MGTVPGRLLDADYYCDGGNKLPFNSRRPLRLSIPIIGGGENYIRESNLSDDDIILVKLASLGYDTLPNLKLYDTDDLYDIIEYEIIKASIEQYQIKEAQRGRS